MDILIKMNIGILKKDFLKENLDSFIQIISDTENEYWDESNFLADLPLKWESSLYAEIDNKIAGFIIASKKSDAFHIHKFFVHPDYRSKKIGLALLEKFQDEISVIHSCRAITLKVYKNNVKAIQFYLRNNFTIREETDELLLLKKELS